jgi:hypothetical protein
MVSRQGNIWHIFTVNVKGLCILFDTLTLVANRMKIIKLFYR